jgi:hypothetical protein
MTPTPAPEHRDPARRTPSTPILRRQRLRLIVAGVASICLLAAGIIAVVLSASPDRDGPHRTSDFGVSREGGEPTGARIPFAEPIEIGECVEVKPMPQTRLALYRADCDNALLVLDSVQPRCPDHVVSIINDVIVASCFVWLVKAGDCIDLVAHSTIACHPAPPEPSHHVVIEIVSVLPGAYDGDRCPDPDSYFYAGRGDDRGVACYRNLDWPDTTTGTRWPTPTATPTATSTATSTQSPSRSASSAAGRSGR